MKEKLTILQVHNLYQLPGGEDTVAENERRLLQAQGHRVVRYFRDNKDLKDFSFFRKLLLPLTTVFNPKTYRDVRRLIRGEHIDIVHVHNTLNLISPAVYYAALAEGVPVVQTMHNFRLLCPGATFYRDGQICEDCLSRGLGCAVKHSCYRGSRLQTLACVLSTILHRATGIYGRLNYICLTDFNREKLLNLKQIEPERVFVKPNFTYSPALTDGDVYDGGYYLYMGRVETLKGIDVLLDAFAQLPDSRLLIAGSGENLDEYRRRAGENVVFLGQLSREQLTEQLRGARAVVAAPQCYESFGMVVIEAYAAHKAVICGDLGNMACLVEDGRTGLLYPYQSGHALAETIRRFEGMDGRAMGEEGYRRYCGSFTPERNYTRLREIYGCAVESCHGTTPH